MGMVSHTLDTLPPLTEEDRAELRALANKPDSELDLEDIPELTEEQWAKAIPNPYRWAHRATMKKAHV